MPTKRATKWTQKEVRDLVMEILMFQSDSVQGSIASLSSEDTAESTRLSREQANSIISILEPTLKDSAFKVLASKKL
tara:strand:+ start:8906 stop:9136 length:231 start_codon:yes stop_codon:yes gene_type:complete